MINHRKYLSGCNRKPLLHFGGSQSIRHLAQVSIWNKLLVLFVSVYEQIGLSEEANSIDYRLISQAHDHYLDRQHVGGA